MNEKTNIHLLVGTTFNSAPEEFVPVHNRRLPEKVMVMVREDQVDLVLFKMMTRLRRHRAMLDRRKHNLAHKTLRNHHGRMHALKDWSWLASIPALI
jgi:hypothetical protein